MSFTPAHYSAERVSRRIGQGRASHDFILYRLIGSVFPPIPGAKDDILGNGLHVRESPHDSPRPISAAVWAEGDRASNQAGIVALEYYSPHDLTDEKAAAIGALLLGHGQAIGSAAEGDFGPLEQLRGATPLDVPAARAVVTA